jgi:hypothetical protein
MKTHRYGGGFFTVALGLVLAVLSSVPLAWAGDRALLIGVGKYQKQAQICQALILIST